MSLQLNYLKNKIVSVVLIVFVISFVWIFIGSMGPERQIEHESIEDMQKEINTSCYYFDISQVISDYTSFRIVRQYWTNEKCSNNYYSSSKDRETGYSLMYHNERGNYYCDAYFNNSSYDHYLITGKEADVFTIEINSVEYKYKISKNSFSIYSPKVDRIVFIAWLEISIEGINYAFYTERVWNFEMSSIGEQEIFDSIKAEVENGLFERIYNTGCKKDGTKLVAD